MFSRLFSKAMEIFKFSLICLWFSPPGNLAEEPINIEITVGASNANFEFHGQIESAISSEDEEAFDITRDNLKRGIEAVMGAWPDFVCMGYCKDIYRERKWSIVKRILHPIKSKVLNIHTEPIVISVQTFSNQFNQSAVFKAGISSTIKNTVSSSWFDSNSLSTSKQISYGLNFKMPGAIGSELSAGLSNSNTKTYTTNWGVTSFEETSSTVGSSSEVSVELSPGQEAVAILSATKGYLEVEITFVASLRGDVACYFSNMHRGRYYWKQDVNTVLNAIDIPIHILARQILKIEYYSEAKVTLKDKSSNKKLYEGQLWLQIK